MKEKSRGRCAAITEPAAAAPRRLRAALVPTPAPRSIVGIIVIGTALEDGGCTDLSLGDGQRIFRVGNRIRQRRGRSKEQGDESELHVDRKFGLMVSMRS
jgi:hypothetical protein